MERPNYLPNYSNPPLDEMVLGVQFTPVSSFTSVNAQAVWDLFKEEFPKVIDQHRLEPNFETFGGSNPQSSVKFHVGTPPVGSRLWFLSKDENHLLQFQPDRFLSNWRKRPNHQDYPRFEGIAKSFEEDLSRLLVFFEKKFAQTLEINQAEIAYINIIPVENFSEASNWFSIWNDDHLNIETLSTSFNEVVYDDKRTPVARLIHEIQSVVTSDGKHKAFKLSLTFRGKPFGNGIADGMKFIQTGREKIVTRFDEITTHKAHKVWGKLG